MTLVPPIPYFGGKLMLAEEIVSHFPEHDRYCEPFMGSLAVLLAKPPERVEVVNDLDSRLVAFWRTLRDRGDELERYCALTPHSREEYNAAKKGPPPDDELENARQFFVLYTQSVAGSYIRSGWRSPGRTRKSPGVHISRFAGRFEGLVDRLAHVSIENYPWQKIVGRYLDDECMLMYVDPPYLATTRSAGDQYAEDMSSEAAHRELLTMLLAAKGPIVLSGYPSDLYSEMLADWTTVTIASTAQTGQPRTEVLYINRTPPAALFGGNDMVWEEE